MSTKWVVRTTLGILISIGVASTAVAQYPGGGTTSGTGTYSSSGKSYGSGAAIGIGAGAAAAVVGTVLYVRHRHHAVKAEHASLMGCTAGANGMMTLMDDSTKTTYSLTSLSKDIGPGERVELAGTKSQDASGRNSFRVQELVKDHGACNPQSAANLTAAGR